jgi:hypothetical protein
MNLLSIAFTISTAKVQHFLKLRAYLAVFSVERIAKPYAANALQIMQHPENQLCKMDFLSVMVISSCSAKILAG